MKNCVFFGCKKIEILMNVSYNNNNNDNNNNGDYNFSVIRNTKGSIT